MAEFTISIHFYHTFSSFLNWSILDPLPSPSSASHVSNGSSGGAGEAGPGSGTAWAAWVVVPSFFFGNFGWNMKDTWCFFGEENIHTSYMYILYIHNLTCFYDSWKGGTECIGIVGQNGHAPVFATGTNRGILETITTGLQVNGVPLGHSLALCRKLVE